MLTNKDQLAKNSGFIIGISELVYEKRISLFNYLYIEKVDKSYILYRMDIKTNKTRVLKQHTTFFKAMEKAKEYQRWFNSKN